MKHLFTLLFLVPVLCQAQENYVVTAANSDTPGYRNTLVGPNVGVNITSGRFNTFMGYSTGNKNTSGEGNTFLGTAAGSENTTGNNNVFVGSAAGANNIDGYQNTFLGLGAGFSNSSGSNNVFVGERSATFNTSGFNNCFVGYETGMSNTYGWRNTYLGSESGYSNTAGYNNVFLGNKAGYNNSTGYNNVMLGANAQPTSNNLQNVVAIGYNATVALNNSIVLGDPTNTSIAVGIGTDSPQFPLDVRGTINLRNNGRIKFAHLSNPIHQGATDQFLTVNEVGETVLATYRLRINNTNQWSDKVFSPTYQLKPLAQVEQHINQHGHLPDVPSADEVVKDGVDLVKMNALLLQKVEELTLYSIQQQKQILEQQKRIEKLERNSQSLCK